MKQKGNRTKLCKNLKNARIRQQRQNAPARRMSHDFPRLIFAFCFQKTTVYSLMQTRSPRAPLPYVYNFYVHIYLYKYIYLHTHTHTHTHSLYTYTYIYIYTYTYIYSFVCVYVCIYITKRGLQHRCARGVPSDPQAPCARTAQ